MGHESRRPDPEDTAALSAMSVGDRVRLALALGERDLETFRRSHRPPLTREEAQRRLAQQRQQGRRPSRSIASLIG